MTTLDYVVLVAYFLLMTLIGVLSMLKVKKQEDFFLGSRTFGRIFQTFAAFGAGTGSHDPVSVGRTTYTSGLSGIWSVLLWLFVTPFYWITGVWYRRMRHITLGDWFVERYQCKSLGVAFTLFAIAFYMVYLALGFTAIGKVGAPLVEVEEVAIAGIAIPIEHVLVYICALVVLVYGVLGGLRAAYWTDLIQGLFIILLSVLLIPMGLDALVEKQINEKGLDPAAMSTLDGFEVMHEKVPDDYFEIVESPRGGEFPLHYIVAITLLNLVAIVVHPHMAATGGGSAKTENAARVGLVTGNFLKRICTIGWCITILIVLAYMAGSLEINEDPDRAWGVAAREILGPYQLGLVGLMLACLMAALMSSASAYMLIVSALVVRNFYAAYINPNASERTYVLLGRIIGALTIIGGVYVSLVYMDVFEQLKLAWEMPILFASLFWIGMFWRRATKWAAWVTVLFTLAAFFVIPIALPAIEPNLVDNQQYAVTNDIVTTIVTRKAAPTDVARREAEITLWQQKVDRWRAEDESRTLQAAVEEFGKRPEPRALGETMTTTYKSGGKGIYWTGPVVPVDKDGNELRFDEAGKVTGVVVKDKEGSSSVAAPSADTPQDVLEEISRVQEDQDTTVVRRRFRDDVRLRGSGRFEIDYFVYRPLGIDLTRQSNPMLETLRLPTRVVLPFVVLIVFSLVTPRVKRDVLDRFYVKMKTPVEPDPEADARELELSYENPSRYDSKRLFPGGGLEMQRPTAIDVAGFVVSFIICFLLIWLTVWVAQFGS